MCDPLGTIGFITGAVSSVALAAHVRKNLQNIKYELRQQQADIEILSLIVSEAERAFISHGRPSEAVRLAMEVCVQRKAEFEESISWLLQVQLLLDEGAELRMRVKIKRFKVAFFDAHKRHLAYQAFHDSVLLLRDLSDRMHTHDQLSYVRTIASDLQIGTLATDMSNDGVEDWEPKKDLGETGEPRNDEFTAQQSLVRILKDGFTFDGVVVAPRENGLKYIAVRGLMDSGCEAYLISRAVIQRAGFTEADMKPVVDLELHGLEGAACKPKFQIELTWYMNRHMNSRVGTFFVIEDTAFDILIPSSLLVNSRSVDNIGQAAYILHLRKKKAAEVQQEMKAEAEQSKRASMQEEADAEERKQNRIQKKKEREEAAKASNASTS